MIIKDTKDILYALLCFIPICLFIVSLYFKFAKWAERKADEKYSISEPLDGGEVLSARLKISDTITETTYLNTSSTSPVSEISFSPVLEYNKEKEEEKQPIKYTRAIDLG